MSNLHAGGLSTLSSVWVRLDSLEAGQTIRFDGLLWTVHEVLPMALRHGAVIATAVTGRDRVRTVLPFTSLTSAAQLITGGGGR